MDTVDARRAAFVIAVLLPAIAIVSFAASGTSAITFNQTQVNISVGSNATVGYAVMLVNGSTGLTNLTINNKAALASQDIYVNASVVSGDPTYAGMMVIQAGAQSLPGKYTVLVTATGLAPSSTSAALQFTIPGNSTQQSGAPPPPPKKPSSNGTIFNSTGPVTLYTTSATTTAMTTIGTNATGHTEPAQQSYWPEIAAVVVVIIICAFLFYRSRSRPKEAPAQS